MELIPRLIRQYFGVRGGELAAGGVPIGAIAGDHETPFFVYDRGILASRLDALRQALPPGFEVFYSVKANPNLKVIQFFVSQGCGLEIASDGEFYKALCAGVSPGRILFAGPGKTVPELEFTLRQGIGEIHIESLLEVERIAAIAGRRGIQARVAVRVNAGEEVQGGAMRMGGKPSPFGVDEELLPEVIGRILGEPSMRFQGVHLFTGTQILDYKILLSQYGKGLELARRAARTAGGPVHTIDFGGGLGIPYFPVDGELDLGALQKGLAPLIEAARGWPELRETRFVVEPGRFLAGEAGIYVTRVNTVKTSRGKKFLIVDGGMNHHLAASGNLGQVIKRNFPVALLNKIEAEAVETVDVVGPLCTPLDVLARDVRLPAAEVGDLVGVFQSGAYARSASPLGFLSRPAPAEIWVEEGRFQLCRPAGTFQEMQ